MIVSLEEALRIFNKLPTEMQSFYFHPHYVLNDAKTKEDLQAVFFAIENSGGIFYHAFHLGKVPNSPYFDIQSPYGYGGPLCIGDTNFVDECTRIYKKWCLDHSVIVEFIRFHPLINNQNNYYGQVVENRQTVYIDLTKEDLFSEFTVRVRTAIRKAQKSNVNITMVKSDEYINLFVDMYNELMNKKNANEDYFFNEAYFVQLLNNDNVYLVSAENELGEVIGSSIFFALDKIAEYHLSATNEEGRKKSVANLMIYEFAKYIEKRNVHSLYLGGGTDQTLDNSLLFFKRGFSNKELPFQIGSFQHNPAVYEKLKIEYIKNNPQKEKFILFYR